jgi:hypothetical protein
MIIELATWLCAKILGPGAVAIFIGFLLDLKPILWRDHQDDSISGGVGRRKLC